MDRLGGCCSPTAGEIFGRTPSAVGTDDREDKGGWTRNLKGEVCGNSSHSSISFRFERRSWEEEECMPSGGLIGKRKLKSSISVLDGELMRTLRGEDKQVDAKRKYRAACGLIGMGRFQFCNTRTGLLVGCT
jgi:hypothetical protein